MLLTVDGTAAYAYTGTRELNADRETIVFVHGAAMDHSVWLLQSRYFAYHERNVLAVDLPGHGRSEGPVLASVAELADWLVQMLSAARVQRAMLIGHSMGSLAVLDAAARYPDRVTKLALLGTAAPMVVGQSLLDAAANDEPAAIDMVTIWAHSPSSHLGGNRAPGLWMAGGGKRLLEQAAAGVLHNDLMACNDYQDGLNRAAEVRCPTLVVLGQRDMMTPPRAARGLVEAIPSSETVSLAGCGHMMTYERPGETLDALIAFAQ